MENKKINIAELLKDCPPGMELDSTLFQNLEFDRIMGLNIRCRIKKSNGGYYFYYFTEYGCWLNAINAKCAIFPKGKTTWEDFVPPCKFKDGDIITNIAGDVFIYKETITCSFCGSFASLNHYNHFIPFYQSYLTDNIRFATEDEKQKLLDAIKDNGYRWNEETKTLEKLIEPKFKDGDIVFTHANCLKVGVGNTWISIFKEIRNGGVATYVDCCENEVDYYDDLDGDKPLLCMESDILRQRFATEEEKVKLFNKIKEHGYKWNAKTKTLEKLVVPKFKVGDRIKHRLTGEIYMIMFVLPHGGGTYEVAVTNEIGKSISIKEQDNYELMSDKFDISTLVPFDKVLVRHNTNEKWDIDFFSCIDNGKMFRTITGTYVQCIPYEGNEHLLDTDKDCNDYYKSWED